MTRGGGQPEPGAVVEEDMVSTIPVAPCSDHHRRVECHISSLH